MSTTRYTNAGAPGTGTTTDNMMSRVVAWSNFSQGYQGAPVSRNSFNVGSFIDIAVGQTGLNFVARFANATPTVVNNHIRAVNWVNSGNDCYHYEAALVRVQAMENLVYIDAGTMFVHVTGQLA